MGTIGNQPARNQFDQDLSSFIDELVELGKKKKLTIDQVIGAYKVLELQRQNNIAIQDGDYFDEQMGGIGDKLSEIASAIRESNS